MNLAFPELTPSPVEVERLAQSGERLLGRLRDLFQSEYGLSPPLKISGSTQKGTALPSCLFPADLDASVLADPCPREKVHPDVSVPSQSMTNAETRKDMVDGPRTQAA